MSPLVSCQPWSHPYLATMVAGAGVVLAALGFVEPVALALLVVAWLSCSEA